MCVFGKNHYEIESSLILENMVVGVATSKIYNQNETRTLIDQKWLQISEEFIRTFIIYLLYLI